MIKCVISWNCEDTKRRGKHGAIAAAVLTADLGAATATQILATMRTVAHRSCEIELAIRETRAIERGRGALAMCREAIVRRVATRMGHATATGAGVSAM